MKAVHTKSVLVGTVLSVASLASGSVWAGSITGSKHDFSGEAWNPTTQICVVCHAPHNGSVVADAPLWNHELTTKTFTPYQSATFDGKATIVSPDGVSKLCLSCHDGTVALDSFGSFQPGDPNNKMTGSDAVGADGVANDHPISFEYTTALASQDGALYDPATTSITIGSGTQTKTGYIKDVLLFNNKLQCASCHDVHNTYTVAGGPLLKLDIHGSKICLTCHKK